MIFVSYSQNFEDVILWRALKHISNGFYIDVGANDPISDSITKSFYDRGWSGINIEPLQSHYKELLQARPRDINLNCAAGNGGGLVELWECDIRGWATSSPEVIEQHKKEGHKGSYHKVPIESLTNICEQHANLDIHFLKIDVEGFEKSVLESMDFSLYRPWILLIEATKPNTTEENYSTWEYLVLNSDYVFAYADGVNRYYVANERKEELLPSLKYPPNIFDKFISSDQFNIGKRAQQVELKLQDAELKLHNAELRLEQLELNLKYHINQIENIYSSISWKITKPIRFIKRFFFEKISRQQLIIRIKLIIRKIILWCISIINKNQKIALLSKRILNRFPIIKKRLIRMQKSNFSSLSHYQSDFMSIRASQIYQDIKLAVENNKKDK
ncbi:FkbM family methyltransferase [Vibrio fluvialis]|uniref:FkbM family methyltransferase n=1 Tax=Vibrio fluvialis TaxID=676 RepID=UPI00192CBD18|nr:FkbM family methyltransferase [Vibrio fluvialis]MBL4307087.1 FkbM family methyltransferase [Vibrio fluvialis]MBY7847279.1 FkbM family methyltransferase [Vibrio fluvialis]MBY8082957.1 FkbM family methyltransferase [Vibrio fluvialis]